jgi:hypothetical protein
MNLALGVLVIFLIAIPGIVFRLTYLSSPYSRRTINTTAIDEIFNSLIPAFIFHALFILILEYCGKKVDFQFIYNLLIGNSNAKNIDELNDYLGSFLLYILANTIVNFGFAWTLRYLVLKYKWYKALSFLTIYNRWYAILKPEPGDNGNISVWLDLLVETKDASIIYRGFLTDFWLDKDGGIRELHFENVRRRVFKNDEGLGTPNAALNTLADEGQKGIVPVAPGVNQQLTPPETNAESTTSSTSEESATEELAPEEIQEIDNRYYYIPGEHFIIKYEDVLNMNITYYEEELISANPPTMLN